MRVICPQHQIPMRKGRFSKFCIKCVDPKSRNTSNCFSDMKTETNKWGKGRHSIWLENGTFRGKTRHGRRAHKLATRRSH